jgi:hypothetical protein
MKLLLIIGLISMCQCHLWLSLDEKYLYELNEIVSSYITPLALNESVCEKSGSEWKIEKVISPGERYLSTSNTTITSLHLLPNDFRVSPDSLHCSSLESNYSCSSNYQYYDFLEKD